MSMIRRCLSAIHKKASIIDKSSRVYQVGTTPVTEKLADHPIIERESTPAKIKISTLNNGIRVLTETSPFPTSVHLGVLLDVGTRDETPEISGTLMAMKQTYLRTHTRSNEEMNYCTIQMSGGEFLMNYDQ